MRKPFHPHHRRYEALRAYFLDRQPAAEVVRRFRYSVHSLKVMVSQFRRDLLPLFFRDIPHGRKDRSVAEPLRDEVVRLRKEENLSFRDIAERIKAQGRPIAFHTIWLLLREAGFGHLSRMTSKKWEGPPPSAPPIANVRKPDLPPGREVECRAPLVFLFASYLGEVEFDPLIHRAWEIEGYERLASSTLTVTPALWRGPRRG